MLAIVMISWRQGWREEGEGVDFSSCREKSCFSYHSPSMGSRACAPLERSIQWCPGPPLLSCELAAAAHLIAGSRRDCPPARLPVRPPACLHVLTSSSPMGGGRRACLFPAAQPARSCGMARHSPPCAPGAVAAAPAGRQRRAPASLPHLPCIIVAADGRSTGRRTCGHRREELFFVRFSCAAASGPPSSVSCRFTVVGCGGGAVADLDCCCCRHHNQRHPTAAPTVQQDTHPVTIPLHPLPPAPGRGESKKCQPVLLSDSKSRAAGGASAKGRIIPPRYAPTEGHPLTRVPPPCDPRAPPALCPACSRFLSCDPRDGSVLARSYSTGYTHAGPHASVAQQWRRCFSAAGPPELRGMVPALEFEAPPPICLIFGGPEKTAP